MSISDMIVGRGRTWSLGSLGTLFGQGQSVAAPAPALPSIPANPSGLLAQALAEGSNLALEWEWYATQMIDPAEHDYCLARARWIGRG
jgi:hypothetical protein